MDSTSRKIGKDVLEFYFDGAIPDPSEISQLQQLSHIFGDPHFHTINTITARKMAAKTPQPVYQYLYTHMGTASLSDVMIEGMGSFRLKVNNS